MSFLHLIASCYNCINMTKQKNGFTVLELTFVITVALIASVVFFIQKHNLEILVQDNTRKTAINAMYYGLEEVFYPTNKYYPRTISKDNLKSVDPTLFTDPNGIKFGEIGGSYTYKPTNCDGDKCQGYSLQANLVNEADYIKQSKNN